METTGVEDDLIQVLESLLWPFWNMNCKRARVGTETHDSRICRFMGIDDGGGLYYAVGSWKNLKRSGLEYMLRQRKIIIASYWQLVKHCAPLETLYYINLLIFIVTPCHRSYLFLFYRWGDWVWQGQVTCSSSLGWKLEEPWFKPSNLTPGHMFLMLLSL